MGKQKHNVQKPNPYREYPRGRARYIFSTLEILSDSTPSENIPMQNFLYLSEGSW